jgi:hypothetical protein
MSCGYDEYLSNANKITCGCETLQGANARARIIEQDACARVNYPFFESMPQAVWETRHRYTKSFCLPGQSNRGRSPNNIY